MAAVVRLAGADFDEAISFLDGVFGEHRPHDFATLLPSIYQPCDELMSCNHALREEGRIRAIVGLFPIDWQVGGRRLKVGGIGGVSTHPDARGKGYMGILMRHCVARMKAEGFHLSWLGGQRQRYGYFGYEKCGQSVSLDLGPANLRHACPAPMDLRFEALEPGHSGRLEQAWKMHQAQRVHCRRREPWFHRYLRAWYNRPHAALDESGEMAGYLVATPDGGQVAELVGRDEETALAMAPAWVQARGAGSVRFTLPPERWSVVRRLAAVGESVSVASSGNWQVYDWAATVEALMGISESLPEGEADIGIEGYGTLRMRVRDGRPECLREDAAGVVTWDPPTAMRVLFGPLPPDQVTALPPALDALRAWCPLPLGWLRPDGV